MGVVRWDLPHRHWTMFFLTVSGMWWICMGGEVSFPVFEFGAAMVLAGAVIVGVVPPDKSEAAGICGVKVHDPGGFDALAPRLVAGQFTPPRTACRTAAEPSGVGLTIWLRSRCRARRPPWR